ncbi:hypothetical protein VB834_19510 [Limnoraphis robusta Tam1]|uniref:hypothetical protein n=1 Tax=Limnoraphis robusta TaxID=1118279 RepID=UPI002B1FD8D1|nr:hypothetical protein [Limnoraphis robusta]MEA5501457.1 hypothetical protein [Limnoraphis robusta BA-68 BA1]MEA5541217.1 hypothetical protein [Limnoraphis robusta Tam1]
MLSQQQFWDWVENNIADALGYPVFSIGQEVLFECFGQIVLAEVESYIISTDSNGDLNIQYWLWVDNYPLWNAQNHKDLLKLNPIANNLPRSRRHHDHQNPTDGNCSRD